MLNEQMKQFKSPGPDFRGAPFWAWNAKLEPEELIRQIRLMKEMGLGGFFMHARVGLNTEYLGKEWFGLINAGADISPYVPKEIYEDVKAALKNIK